MLRASASDSTLSPRTTGRSRQRPEASLRSGIAVRRRCLPPYRPRTRAPSPWRCRFRSSSATAARPITDTVRSKPVGGLRSFHHIKTTNPSKSEPAIAPAMTFVRRPFRAISTRRSFARFTISFVSALLIHAPGRVSAENDLCASARLAFRGRLRSAPLALSGALRGLRPEGGLTRRHVDTDLLAGVTSPAEVAGADLDPRLGSRPLARRRGCPARAAPTTASRTSAGSRASDPGARGSRCRWRAARAEDRPPRAPRRSRLFTLGA